MPPLTETEQERIFNYMLSRNRRISENCFGILTSRNGVLQKPILLSPEKAEKAVMAACIIHNFLRARNSSSRLYTPPGYVDSEDANHNLVLGHWRNHPESEGISALAQQGSNNYSLTAKEVRDELTRYFNSEVGRVPWQRKILGLD